APGPDDAGGLNAPAATICADAIVVASNVWAFSASQVTGAAAAGAAQAASPTATHATIRFVSRIGFTSARVVYASLTARRRHVRLSPLRQLRHDRGRRPRR